MLWGVACYFNPAGFARPLENLRQFSAGVRSQGLPLTIVELAIGDAPFGVDESMCDRLVRRRSDEALWHKEALLNIGIRDLPAECDKVCWLDADLLFDNPGWVAGTESALERHRVVQPFAYCTWLPPGETSVDPSLTTYPAMHDEYNRMHSFGFGWTNFGVPALEARILYGHVGFAWAARREIIEDIGLYDADIYAGSSDNLMAHAFVGHEAMLRVDGPRTPPAMLRHFERWAGRAHERVRGDVGYVGGEVHHLWHGSSAHRQYLERLLVMRDCGFDPERHLVRGDDGLYRLRDAPPELHRALRRYFVGRREDAVPEDAGLCVFGDGFYADEGAFRWSRRVSELRIARSSASFKFRLSNNALGAEAATQRIDIARNGAHLKTVMLEDTRRVEVDAGAVARGDLFSFSSDFDFQPSARGGSDDHRLLSFMFS